MSPRLVYRGFRGSGKIASEDAFCWEAATHESHAEEPRKVTRTSAQQCAPRQRGRNGSMEQVSREEGGKIIDEKKSACTPPTASDSDPVCAHAPSDLAASSEIPAEALLWEGEEKRRGGLRRCLQRSPESATRNELQSDKMGRGNSLRAGGNERTAK